MPTAAITPNITRNMPPITGMGMLASMAPTFPKMPLRSMAQAPAMITIRLPTCAKRKRRQSHTDWQRKARGQAPEPACQVSAAALALALHGTFRDRSGYSCW